MDDEYSRLKARYREARRETFCVCPDDEKIKESDRQAQELEDFCVASGIDREDLHQFLAEVDQDIIAEIPQ